MKWEQRARLQDFSIGADAQYCMDPIDCDDDIVLGLIE